LSIKYSDHLIWNPDTGQNDKVNLRTYYDCLVGPTLTVRPGNRLRLLLKNDLPINDPKRCPLIMNTPDCFNSGNMHTRGLHVSPAGNGDNVLISVDPGQSFPYEYNIPSDHPAGTFWYHSHRHGSTALSVTSGMEGVLIVKGNRPYVDRDKNNGVADIDTILHDKAGHEFKERVLLLQQIAYGCFSDPDYEHLETDAAKKWIRKQGEVGVVENYKLQFGPGSWPESGRYTGINGKVQPLWQAHTGEIERWRLIHGGVRDTINFQIVKATNAPVASTESGASPVLRPMAAINLDTTGALQEVMSGAEALRGDALKNFVDQSCAAPDNATATQFEIAEDGLTRREITPKTLNILNPGQRSDVLIFFNEPGLYCVLDQSGPGENTIIATGDRKAASSLRSSSYQVGNQSASPRTTI
jgi:FtsP/CotA-like multicopper oxidase with cupredoxin domain